MKKPLILVAEDEQDVRELIIHAFEFSGFDVDGVQNGEEAVKAAAKRTPDLILLDVRMPKMTGLEACQQFKADANTKNIPVVFLSAYGQEAEVNMGLGLGAEIYLIKPFDVADLIGQIRGILSKYGKLI